VLNKNSYAFDTPLQRNWWSLLCVYTNKLDTDQVILHKKFVKCSLFSTFSKNCVKTHSLYFVDSQWSLSNEAYL
jgi:hypothetical protein